MRSVWIIFSVISVLLTTENSDDLDIRIPDGSRSWKATSVIQFLVCHFLLVIRA